MTDKFQNDIKNLVEEFNLNGQKKFKLIVLFGLLGDFDSFEYAINLKNFLFALSLWMIALVLSYLIINLFI